MFFYRRRKERTFRSIERALSGAMRISENGFRRRRYVVFSDIHKGDKRRSDDFQANEMILLHALQYYYQRDYRLILAGDNEEGWECRYRDIAAAYRKTIYFMEKKFNRRGRDYYLRLYGNHDEKLSDPRFARRFLTPLVGATRVYPAVMLGPRLIIIHGHQGEEISDRHSYRGYLLTRLLWKPLQKYLGLNIEGMARNTGMKNARDLLLYEWAAAHRRLIIAGHTHRAVFKSKTEVQSLKEVRQRIIDRQDDFERRFLLPGLDKRIAAMERAGRRHNRLEQSLYFNSGCGVYRNGITAIELQAGEIRLIKWEYSDSYCAGDVFRRAENYLRISRKIVETEKLKNILS